MKKLCRILIPGAFDGAICFLLFTYQVQAVESPSAQSPLFWADPGCCCFYRYPEPASVWWLHLRNHLCADGDDFAQRMSG